MNIALAHEHLAQDGGAEKVLREFQLLYPTAPTYTIVYNKEQANPVFRDKDIRTSYIQRMPFGVSKYRWYLPSMPIAVEKMDFTSFDVVLSSSSAFIKGLITRADAVHICYCHSPTRYLWADTHSYVESLPYPRIMKNIIARSLSRLRMWDRLAADRVDFFIANSKTVQQRIAKYYRRESTVIYPPVATHKFSISNNVGKYFLTGGRLVAYKRFDLAVMAANESGLPLKIFGSGPEEDKLRAMAHDNVEFVGRVSDDEKAKLFAEALAFVNPQEEDFGITVVESMAAGRPVIAYARGGAVEIVQPGKSGVLFDEQSWEPIADAMIRMKQEDYDPQAIKAWAEQFSEERFRTQIQAFVAQHSTTPVTTIQ